MRPDVYVTGTDTGIGKTFASCALLHALRGQGMRAVGMKPVASGCTWLDGGWKNDDALAPHQWNAALNCRQFFGVGGQLVFDHVKICERVTPRFQCGAINHMDDHRTAFNVAEKLESEPPALRCPGNESGNVSDRVALVSRLHHTEVRYQRGKRIIGNLGASGGHGRDDGGLACTWEANERHIGNRLELENNFRFLALIPKKSEAWGLALRGCERRIAQAARATARNDVAGLRANQICENLAIGGAHYSARGDLDDEVSTVASGAHIPCTLCARIRLLMGRVVIGQKSGLLRIYAHHYVAAVTAVCSVRTSQRLKLLTLHGSAPVAAIARLGVDSHSVNEGGHIILSSECDSAF